MVADSLGHSKLFFPLTLVIVAIFFMIKTGWQLRLTAIKARVTVFLFVPPYGGFFALKTGVKISWH